MLLRQIKQAWYREVKLGKLSDVWALRKELDTLQTLYQAGQVKLAQERAHCIYRKKKSFQMLVSFPGSISLLRDLAILLPTEEAVELIGSKEFQRAFIPYQKAQASLENIMKHHKNDAVNTVCQSLLQKMKLALQTTQQSHSKPNKGRMVSLLHTPNIGVTFDDYKRPPGNSHSAALQKRLGSHRICFFPPFESGDKNYQRALVWHPKAT